MTRRILVTVTLVLAAAPADAQAAAKAIGEDVVKKITDAAPAKATAAPAKPRKLLVFTLCRGFRHSSIPYASKALEIMGAKTGAYETEVTDDLAVFDPARLKEFDAVCLNNTTGRVFSTKDIAKLPKDKQAEARKRDAARKRALWDFLRGGGGLVGIHAATDGECSEFFGARFAGHPWSQKVAIKLDDPAHPLCAAFGGKGFEVNDEIYQFGDPYSRTKLRVLMSLDMAGTPDRGRRWDKDHAVSWVRPERKGRVFYCSLGHRHDIFWNSAILKHYLDGIQFAMGDLKAEAAPAPMKGGQVVDSFMGVYEGTYTPAGGEAVKVDAQVMTEGAFNFRAAVVLPAGRAELRGGYSGGKVLLRGRVGKDDWEGTIADGKLSAAAKGDAAGRLELKKVDRRSPTAGAKPPAGAVVVLAATDGPPSLDAWTNANWKPLPGGVMEVGRGDNRTKRKFGDCRLHVEFMVPYEPAGRGQGRGNSGVYLQDRYEVQVLDSFGLRPGMGDCGAIYGVAPPRVNACLPPLTWQTYDMTFRAPRIGADGKMVQAGSMSVVHNGVTIHENAQLKGTTRAGSRGVVQTGPLKLQYHGHPVRYRNIWIVELKD